MYPTITTAHHHRRSATVTGASLKMTMSLLMICLETTCREVQVAKCNIARKPCSGWTRSRFDQGFNLTLLSVKDLNALINIFLVVHSFWIDAATLLPLIIAALMSMKLLMKCAAFYDAYTTPSCGITTGGLHNITYIKNDKIASDSRMVISPKEEKRDTNGCRMRTGTHPRTLMLGENILNYLEEHMTILSLNVDNSAVLSDHGEKYILG